MGIWEWESFEDIICSSRFQVIDSGPLYGPITNFSIKRNQKLKLVFSSFSAGDSVAPEVEWVSGTVRTNLDSVEFKDYFGCTARAVGVTPVDHRASHNYITNDSSTRQESTVNYVEANFPNAIVDFKIDWVLNMGDGIMWPHSEKQEVENVKRVWWGVDGFEVSSKDTRGRNSNSCFCFSVAGMDIVVGRSQESNEDGQKRGYILYKGDIDDDVRSKIRGCLSFALGSYLVYLGTASFSKSGQLGYLKSLSAYSIGGRVFEIGGLAPAPLGFTYERELNPEVASRMINALYESYDKFNLQYLFWQYWHAQCAPYHIAAVHFGAAIESLQKRYMDVCEKLSLGSIMSKGNWRKLYAGLKGVVESGGFDSGECDLLIQQLGNLNRAPQKIVMERFLNALGISLGTVELDAWQHRNDAAHGNEISSDGQINLIRGNKVLRVMLDRMILKMTNASDYYVDYYSYGFPVRALTDPIPTSE